MSQAFLGHSWDNLPQGLLLMATFEFRKDKNENIIAVRAKVRRAGISSLSKTFPIQGARAADRNVARRQAERWANEVESEIDRGTFISMQVASKTRLRACLTRYLEEVSAQKKGAYQEKSKIKIILQHPIVDLLMSEVRSHHIAQYRNDRLEQVIGDTVRRELAIVSNMFNVARSEWDMEGLINPVELVKLPPPSKPRSRRVMQNELDMILSHTGSQHLSALLLLFIETAMRRSEMVSLSWKNVHLNKQYALLIDTKNDESREVPLSSRAVAELALIEPKIGLVFHLRADSVTQCFGRAKKRARKTYVEQCLADKVEPDPDFLVTLRLHDLRHEAASSFFEKGLNMMEVATMTGHKDLKMLKRYTHLRSQDIALKLG